MLEVIGAAFVIVVIGLALGLAMGVCMFIAISAMEFTTRFWDRH